MAVDPLAGDLCDFLECRTDPARFRHADHVRMAFAVLRLHGEFADAALIYSRALRAIAARAGQPGLYHDTITFAFLSLIAERMAAAPEAEFESFAARNADLFDNSLLGRWYDSERLQLPLARKTFLLPLRAP